MRCSKGLDMKWSLYMSSNQQNLTIGSIGLKSDYRVVKISLTTGLGSYPKRGSRVALSDLAPKSSQKDRVDRIARTKKRTYNSIGKSTEEAIE